jgi:protein O-GlcNAc transferase
MSKIGRNDPCLCGSGKKHKQCCGKVAAAPSAPRALGEVFDRALQAFQSGRLTDAEVLCQQVLQSEPKHADAWHLLGVIAYENKRYDASAAAIHNAIAAAPANAHYHNTLGVVLADAGKCDAAIASCQRALSLQPNYAEAHYNLGKALQRQNKLDAAITSYRKALANQPGYVLAHCSMGDALQAQGRLAEAVACYRKAIALNADFPEAHCNLGKALQGCGEITEAITCFRRAMALRPRFAEACNNLGNALRQQGSDADAIACYREAIAYKEAFAEAHNNLGAVLQKQDAHEEAVVCYHRALALDPTYAEAHCNLGALLQLQGKVHDAVASYELALLFNPSYANAHCNLGKALQDQGKTGAAEACYRRAISLLPNHVAALCNLGSLLQEQGSVDAAIGCYNLALIAQPTSYQAHSLLASAFKDAGRLDEAKASYRCALVHKPDFAEAHNNLGAVLQLQGDLTAAIDSYLCAIACRPDYGLAHNNLGTTYKTQGRFADAVASFHRALACLPNYAEAHSNLGTVLELQGQADAAVACYQRAIACQSDCATAFSNWLFVRAYSRTSDVPATLAHARTWELACVPERERQIAGEQCFSAEPLAGRRLRVGYVSGDFRRHPVSYFVEQLFAHHDRSRIELYAYSTTSECDEVTKRLQAAADHWVPLHGRVDAAMRDRIAADNIDVLIDLAGHTAGNRMGVFARRAAPVQAHYLGFFGTTGLTQMDYWIGDEVLTPGDVENEFSEQVWRLPRVSVSYAGDVNAPASSWQPAHDGTVWLGTFNNLIKVNDATLALWAKVLHALPEARLLLKTQQLADDGNRRRILAIMAERGISAERIELRDCSDTRSWSAHMACYDRLDIALDPIGSWGGNTTTCDALWMSVPVITLKGGRIAERMTASMLTALGHSDWIARTEQEYIDTVVLLARSVEVRKTLRATQRSGMAASALCNARELAASLENAYLQMYELWYAHHARKNQAAA